MGQGEGLTMGEDEEERKEKRVEGRGKKAGMADLMYVETKQRRAGPVLQIV